jgi:leucyl aminopeptidase
MGKKRKIQRYYALQYKIKSGSPEKQRTPCQVVTVFEDAELDNAAKILDDATGNLISGLVKRGDISGEKSTFLMLPNVPGIPAERLLVAGCGKKDEFSSSTLMQVTGKIVSQLNQSKISKAAFYIPETHIEGCDMARRIEQVVIAAELSDYRYEETKSERKKKSDKIQQLDLYVADRASQNTGKKAVEAAKAIASGINLARQLGNLPGNICTPTYLADKAMELGRKSSLKTKVLNEKAMEKLGMGALLSVSRGSRQEAKLIILEHMGGKKSQKPVVLVGKGLTFDAGGISIKPSAAMDEMKFDMCGGASVLGTMQAISSMNLPLNVVGIVPSSENLPDGNANKPGDIVTSMSGQTIEILNTDAEGRLILCDALTYAERYKPSAVIDIATLTGACVVALGEHASGLFSNNDNLADEIITAGTAAQDRAWKMPLWEEYDQQLKSNFADMANIGGPKAGAITAASFLARYTKKYDWAHLDIAGTAWLSGADKGSTGRPVGLLCEFLRQRAAKA